MKSFSMYPFDTNSDLKLSGSIDRSDNQLILQYNLIDDLNQVLIPAAHSPTRQNNLWQTTCFEFFLGIQDFSQYWEFNLSPSGDWNVYCFEDYRAGMQKEQAFTELPFQFEIQEKQSSLAIAVDLNPIIHPAQKLDVGITTVIETLDQHITYWAIQHSGAEADFHLRESFVIEI